MDVEYDQRKARWHVSLNFIEEAEDITEVALEWLFCSDNTLNMFGWYVTSDVQLGKILQMIGFGVVVQAVPRLVGLPVLAHYFAQSPEARHVTSSLLFITACRNMYVAWTMKYEDRTYRLGCKLTYLFVCVCVLLLLHALIC